MSWLENPSLWVPLAGIAAQAIITWWRVGELDKNHRMLESKHDREFGLLWSEIDSLREWRAQAREKLGHLERRRRGPEDEESDQ